MEKFVEIKVHSYTQEETKIFDKMLESLLINLYGEANREGGVYIQDFDYNWPESRVCYNMAVNALLYVKDMNKKIYLECSFFKYISFLLETKQLFRRRIVHRMKKKNHFGRSAYSWCTDISNAYNLEPEVWFKVEEYLHNE